MNAVIYGIGRNYDRFFSNEEFLKKGIVESGIEIIGFSDSNEVMWGKSLDYNKRRFQIQKIDDYRDKDIDKIIVTATVYFNEIKEILIKKGFRKEDILSFEQIYTKYLEKVYCIERFVQKKGVEIGGPTELFAIIYDKCITCDNVNFSSNTVWIENNTNNFTYGNKTFGYNIIADATDMKRIESEKYDFILSSNNLEHIANPLKAIKEFSRIIKVGGTVLVLVPMKEKCFDHNREYTVFDHILDDYSRNIQEDDLSHLPEIIVKHDFNMDIACGGKEKFI